MRFSTKKRRRPPAVIIVSLIDGLWDRQIEELIRTAPRDTSIAKLLVEEAVQSSGRDNTTAVVVEAIGATATLAE